MVDEYKDRLRVAMSAPQPPVSTQELADALGISYQAVRKVLLGGRFGTENNAAAAKHLGVSSDWLATGKGPMKAAISNAPAPIGDVFERMTDEERRLLDNFRELVDEDERQKLLDDLSTKAAKSRSMRERILAPYGIKLPAVKHSADAKKMEVARAALDVTDRLRQKTLFDPPSTPKDEK